MCGIVLAGGSLSSGDLDIFNQLLYCDVVRGVHATGIFAKRQDVKDRILVAKAAMQPYPFMQTNEYLSATQGDTKYVVAPTFVVGHNRHATRGNSGDSQNAHPFQHGHITLVHNGTLTDQGLLPDSQRFVVDSDNIAYSISKIGAAETIQKLDGAYTLVWHDATDDTVHIIRNDERPFHLCKVGTVDWFGASEEDMLMWLIKRSKTHKNRITEHFECKVGHEYVFDTSGHTKRFTLKEVIEHKLPTFTGRYGYNYSRRGWQQDVVNTTGRSPASTSNTKLGREAAKADEKQKQNAIAIDNNVNARIDGRISIVPHSWFPYTTGITGKGRITGYVMQTNGEYYEVDIHSCDKGMWEDCMDDPRKEITGTVVSIQKVNGMVRAIIAHPSILDTRNPAPNVMALPPAKTEAVTEPASDLPWGDNLPDHIKLPTGMTMSREQWNKHDHNKCGGCNGIIAWEEAVKDKATFAYNCMWHDKCLEQLLDETSGNDTFLCCCCGKEKDLAKLDSTASAYRHEDVCDDCGIEIRKKRSEVSTNQKWDNSTDLSPTVIYVDKSTSAIINDEDGYLSKQFTRKEFDNMIRMRGSDKAKFEEIQDCYIEKRSATVFAYKFKRGQKKAIETPVKEESAASKVVSFPEKSATPASDKLSKTLVNGQKSLHINKALWNQIGQCVHCYSPIPWRDVESCVLAANNRVICPDCRGT